MFIWAIRADNFELDSTIREMIKEIIENEIDNYLMIYKNLNKSCLRNVVKKKMTSMVKCF